MKFYDRLILGALILLGTGWFCSLSAAEWKLENAETFAAAANTVRARLTGSSAKIFREEERTRFRARPEVFRAGQMEIDVRLLSGSVRARLFVQDKDGRWFASATEFALAPGEKKTLSVPIDRIGRDWLPYGHRAGWCAEYAAAPFRYGLSLYGATPGTELECAPPRFAGERRNPPLALVDWQNPTQGECFELLSGTFSLTREYFNPFDPEEIQADCEIGFPDGSTRRIPAFFTRRYSRSRRLAAEELSPEGLPGWEYRFTAPEPGSYRVRLCIKDAKNELVTPWKTVRVTRGSRPGFVRKSALNPAFFEYSDGSFYFPIGLNIHTNTDLRSEYRFGFGHLPDLGSFDYDEYLRRCGENGINTIEVWMASWSCALEWTSANRDYQGLGRYNLAHAWKLDRILESAAANGVRVNLVWDNHGKASMGTDQEWNDNPFNADGVFAEADGGFLHSAGAFFTDEKARKLDLRRTRYIAARWGADARIFAMELWSEVDLVADFHALMGSGAMQRYHEEVIRDYQRMSLGNHLITTHVCGDYRRWLNFRGLFELPGVTHFAGDAYRGANIHIVDQMKAQGGKLITFQPKLVTEFGGTATGAREGLVRADIHGGLWSSVFLKLAGTPFLWWHDFVHRNDLYEHYRGLSKYLQDVDLRDPELVAFEPRVFLSGSRKRWSPRLTAYSAHERTEALALGSSRRILGWVYKRELMYDYPINPPAYDWADTRLLLLGDRAMGRWRVRWFNPLTGEQSGTQEFFHPGGSMRLEVPAFTIDTAFKMEVLP